MNPKYQLINNYYKDEFIRNINYILLKNKLHPVIFFQSLNLLYISHGSVVYKYVV